MDKSIVLASEIIITNKFLSNLGKGIMSMCMYAVQLKYLETIDVSAVL